MVLRPSDDSYGPARRKSVHPRRGSARPPRGSALRGSRFGAGWVGGSRLTWRQRLFPADGSSPTLSTGVFGGGHPFASSSSCLAPSAKVSPVSTPVVVPTLHDAVRLPCGSVSDNAGVRGPAAARRALLPLGLRRSHRHDVTPLLARPDGCRDAPPLRELLMRFCCSLVWRLLGSSLVAGGSGCRRGIKVAPFHRL
jgi:hypothetical protein